MTVVHGEPNHLVTKLFNQIFNFLHRLALDADAVHFQHSVADVQQVEIIVDINL